MIGLVAPGGSKAGIAVAVLVQQQPYFFEGGEGNKGLRPLFFGGTLSAKPLDDRLGEAGLLDAAISAAIGARRGSPARDCFGLG